MDGKYGGSYEMPSFRINTMEMELFNLIATARGRGALKTEKFLEEMCAGYDFALSLSHSHNANAISWLRDQLKAECNCNPIINKFS